MRWHNQTKISFFFVWFWYHHVNKWKQFLNSVYFRSWQSANFIFCKKINMASMNKTFYYGHFCVKKAKCQIVLIEKIRFCYLSCTKSLFFRLIFADFRCFYSPERSITYNINTIPHSALIPSCSVGNYSIGCLCTYTCKRC